MLVVDLVMEVIDLNEVEAEVQLQTKMGQPMVRNAIIVEKHISQVHLIVQQQDRHVDLARSQTTTLRCHQKLQKQNKGTNVVNTNNAPTGLVTVDVKSVDAEPQADIQVRARYGDHHAQLDAVIDSGAAPCSVTRINTAWFRTILYLSKVTTL